MFLRELSWARDAHARANITFMGIVGISALYTTGQTQGFSKG